MHFASQIPNFFGLAAEMQRVPPLQKFPQFWLKSAQNKGGGALLLGILMLCYMILKYVFFDFFYLRKNNKNIFQLSKIINSHVLIKHPFDFTKEIYQTAPRSINQLSKYA